MLDGMVDQLPQRLSRTVAGVMRVLKDNITAKL